MLTGSRSRVVVALLAAVGLLCAASACDTAEALAADIAAGSPRSPHLGENAGAGRVRAGAPLTLLPQQAGEDSPACLDGSPYGFYFNPSRSNSTKWTIAIEGGGWCYDEVGCLARSKMNLGSSKGWAPTAGCGCMNPLDDGSGLDAACNCLYMPYADGASFSGYRPRPWPVPGQPGQYLHFRGIKNLDATLEYALAQLGLADATDFVLTGGSAGGLSTFLHADRVAAAVRRGSTGGRIGIRAAPVVGYFLDHDNFRHSSGEPNQGNWSGANYTAKMEYIYQMQNMSFGGDGGLTAACEQRHPGAPGLCFMSPHMQDVIETPLFMFNSKYDAWQLANELQTGWANDSAAQTAVIQYGLDFMAQFKPFTASSKHGAYITSCICHGCQWASPTILTVPGSAAPYVAYARWATGRDSGAAAIHVDPRYPNGGIRPTSAPQITDKSCAFFR